jgi:hypothetical protein
MITPPYLIKNAEVSIHTVKKAIFFDSYSTGMIEEN